MLVRHRQRPTVSIESRVVCSPIFDSYRGVTNFTRKPEFLGVWTVIVSSSEMAAISSVLNATRRPLNTVVERSLTRTRVFATRLTNPTSALERSVLGKFPQALQQGPKTESFLEFAGFNETNDRGNLPTLLFEWEIYGDVVTPLHLFSFRFLRALRSAPLSSFVFLHPEARQTRTRSKRRQYVRRATETRPRPVPVRRGVSGEEHSRGPVRVFTRRRRAQAIRQRDIRAHVRLVQLVARL